MQMHKNNDRGWSGTAQWAASVTLGVLLAGCGTDAAQGCRDDSECPGQLCVNGSCRSVANPDLTLIGDGGSQGQPDLAIKQTFSSDGGLALDALAASCSFNSDGVIQRSEEPFLVGLGALFAVNPAGSTVPVNETAVSGVWDFSAAVANETKVFDQIQSPSGQWWSKDFPTATYAETLEDGQTVLGVYRASSDKLELLGLVSEQSGAQQTELTYATPVALLQFPISVGDHFTSQSSLTGTFDGLPGFIAQDSYDVTVDVRGTTKVPAGSFDSLRIRVNYSETVDFVTTTRITYLHMAECYGAVARVRSQDNETSNNFTQAAEYRRLATQ